LLKKLSDNTHNLDHLKSVLPTEDSVYMPLLREKELDRIPSKPTVITKKTLNLELII
jgi:hypothetical protein